MTGSMAVFKLVDPDIEKLRKKEIDSVPQRTFADLNLSDSLGQSRSILSFKRYDEEKKRIYYVATHYTDTIKTPIRVFFNYDEDSYFDLTTNR